MIEKYRDYEIRWDENQSGGPKYVGDRPGERTLVVVADTIEEVKAGIDEWLSLWYKNYLVEELDDRTWRANPNHYIDGMKGLRTLHAPTRDLLLTKIDRALRNKKMKDRAA